MSKKIIFWVGLLGLLWWSNLEVKAARKFPEFNIEEEMLRGKVSKKYAQGEVLIKFKKDKVNLENVGLISFFRQLNTSWSNNLDKDDVLKPGNIVVYKIKDGRSVEEAIEQIKLDPNVETAEPNYYFYMNNLGTDDTLKNNLWGLDNVGQTIVKDSGVTTIGTNGADIDMVRAWGESIGTSEVVVAVIDGGVNYNHPDLVNSMWDGSVCVDDQGATISGGCIHGYNFYSNSNDPAPDLSISTSSHGTHVAGIIAAGVNNGVGVAGVSPKIKIMSLNCDDDLGTISLACVIKSIDFARRNGAKVINASFGSSSYSSFSYEAISRFRDDGGIFVAAAGNGGDDSLGDNNETEHLYPSDYDLDNIISVAATDNNDELADFSNYGMTSVDVAAPGVDILSTVIYRQDYYEDFENISIDVGSNWETQITNTGEKIMWTDGNMPYLDNSDYRLTSETINLSSLDSFPADFSFVGVCDDLGTTSVGGVANGDYVALEFSGDGVNFTEISKWNESTIEAMEDGVCSSGICANTFNFTINNTYLTNNFKYRLRWVTDGSLNNSYGCYVRNIKIIDYNEATAGYDYYEGTSMAAPYVAGLAGYLWSVNPSATYSEVANSILNFGDTLDSLSGKIKTGKRINAYNSVLNIGVGETTPTPTPTDSQPTPTPTDSQPTPTPTNPQPTPTDTQPTPTNPQPTPTDSQPTPTPTNPQPTPTDTQPTPTNPQPTPTDSQPTPTDTQPTPTNPQPTPTDSQPTPTPTVEPVTIGSTDIPWLIDSAVFSIPAEEPSESVSMVLVNNELFINVGEGSTLATINLAINTEITELSGGAFDSGQIAATIMDKNNVSSLTSGFSAVNLLQWGVPGETLVFSIPVHISMYVGGGYNGQTLSVLRSTSVSSGWTSDGLVNTTCLVVDGYCGFLTNRASYFTVVNYQAPVNTNNNNQSVSGANNVFVCTDMDPIVKPDLFELRATKGKAKLFFTPSDKATLYAVLYGFKKGDERFGAIVGTTNNNQGVQKADILALNPKSTYYFKVAAINGCTIGPWSDWAPIRANKTRTVFRYRVMIKKGIRTLIDLFSK